MIDLQRQRRSRAHRGFTMIEILLVIVIIMTLAAVVGPRVVGKSQAARINATKISMQGVKTNLINFELNAGRFPTSSEGLEALIRKPSGLSDEEWPDKYVDSLPRDAWNEPFEYKYPSEHGMDFDLTSKGPDKKLGTEDDVNNWDLIQEGDI